MKVFIIGAIALICISSVFADNSFPVELHASLERAVQASSFIGTPVPSEDVPKRQKAFLAAFSDFANHIDGKFAKACKSEEGDSMDCKFASMALVFAKNPEFHRKIFIEYLYAPLMPLERSMHADPRFPSPRPDVLNDAYRLTWEAMLVWPEQERISNRTLWDFHLNCVLQALQTIQSPNSQIMYEYCFIKKANLYSKEGNWDSQTEPWNSLLAAMAQELSPKSILRMLRCLDSLKANGEVYGSARQRITGVLMGIQAMWIESYFKGTTPKEILSNPQWCANRQIWANAIAQVPKKNVSLDDQMLLNGLLTDRSK